MQIMKGWMAWVYMVMILACSPVKKVNNQAEKVLKPVVVSEKTPHDTDDPAIWIHPSDPGQSLVIGTDKDQNGGLYVFDLEGHIVQDKVIEGIQRPNNVDVEYDLVLGDSLIDIAVVTERLTQRLRVFSLPDMRAIDQGGFPVFEGETARAPMGVALYRKPSDGRIFAFVSRKTGPREGYLGQYELLDNGKGQLTMQWIRYIGQFSGSKEIEAIAVDDQLGYVYYSDEAVGIRKYHADPDSSALELAMFGIDGFAEDREGISILPTEGTEGFILVSDQQANAFRVYARNQPGHPFLASLPFSTNESDGSDLTVKALNTTFSKGLFVAMSDDRTFQFYRLEDLVSEIEEAVLGK